jgi:hypothetical protein
LPSGWTVASSSTSTNLYLGGPDGLFADFTTQTVGSAVTLTQVFEVDLSNFQQNSEFTNVSECEQPQSGDVPGTPKEPGAAEVICFTITPQGGNAVPYAALVANGLVQGSGSQLLLSVVGFAPQGTSSSTLQQDLAPELASAQWLQLNGS